MTAESFSVMLSPQYLIGHTLPPPCHSAPAPGPQRGTCTVAGLCACTISGYGGAACEFDCPSDPAHGVAPPPDTPPSSSFLSRAVVVKFKCILIPLSSFEFLDHLVLSVRL